MSKNRKRTSGRAGQRMAYAATSGRLGQQPNRNRRIDRAVTGTRKPYGENTDSEPVRPVQIGPVDWAVITAGVLTEYPKREVPRAILRAALPDAGPTATRSRWNTGSGGAQSSRKLSKVLVRFERLGWVRRTDMDTVIVLDLDALRQVAAGEHTDP